MIRSNLNRYHSEITIINRLMQEAGNRQVLGQMIPKPVAAHGGCGAGRSVEDIREICGGTVEEEPLEICCGDIPYCGEQVTEWLKGL
ncbi:MAG: hypothetical protein HFH40_13585 [Lachnospiraceae bacterium]|nr:hypothetical protein [Lachnospiraceae bacterium]